MVAKAVEVCVLVAYQGDPLRAALANACTMASLAMLTHIGRTIAYTKLPKPESITSQQQP